MKYIKVLIVGMIFLLIGMVAKAQDAQKLKSKGDALYQAERFIESFDCYTQAMKIAEKQGDATMYELCLGNIANIFGTFEDYERANVYYNKAFEDALKNDNKDVAAKCVINMVVTSTLMGDAKKAKEYFKLQNHVPLSNPALRRFFLYHSQACIAYAEQNYPLVISLSKFSYNYATSRKLPVQLIVNLHNDIGKCYIKENKLDSAISAFNKNIEICKKVGDNGNLAESYHGMAEAYDKKGDDKLQAYYLSLYHNLSDSIFSGKLFNMAKNKLFMYEDQKTEHKIRMLSWKYNAALIVAIITFLFVIILGVLARMIFLRNRRLNQAYQALYAKSQDLIKSHEENQGLREKLSVVGDSDIRMQYNEMCNEKLLHEINRVMEDLKYISNPDFSITMLANLVGTNVKYVSTIINEQYGKNFKTYLNEYRIREACKRLSNDEKYGNITIKAIAEGIGYNSINNFIIAFKKIVGMTPSAYQKMAKLGKAQRGEKG